MKIAPPDYRIDVVLNVSVPAALAERIGAAAADLVDPHTQTSATVGYVVVEALRQAFPPTVANGTSAKRGRKAAK